MATQQAEKVLLCNGGSSSLKVCCFDLATKKVEHTATFSAAPEQLIEALTSYLKKNFSNKNNISILHRIVHAGEVSEGACPLDTDLLEKIKHWQVVAPLHNALALQIIAVTRNFFPDAKHYALFDSGLFSKLPALAKFYALPRNLSEHWPIQRYGFHGIAHRSQWNQLQEVSSNKVYQRIITLQLGSGCSVTAWCNGQVMDTSMGFSPLEGLAMVTRSGSIDPGIVLHLLEQENFSLSSVKNLLNKQAGIQGLSGSKLGIIDILHSDNEVDQFAVNHFCYQISKMIGAYMVVLGGLDAISFGGGVAENNPKVREKILSYLTFTGFQLNKKSNLQTKALTALHNKNSKIHAWLTPVDEMQEMFESFLRGL